MAGVRAPNFVIDCVKEYKKVAFETQSKNVLISSYTTKAAFAVFLYGFLSSETNATDVVLCVHGDENEKREWMEVATEVFQTKKTSSRRFNIVDFDAKTSLDAVLPPTPLVAFIHCNKLESLFPYQQQFSGISPYTSSTLSINEIAYSYSANAADPRAFAMSETPINYKNSRPSDPYSIVWDHVAFSHSALRRSSTVFYLNALSVCLNRFLLDDDEEDPEEEDLHYYYNVLYASTNDMPSYVRHNEEVDDADTLRIARDNMYELIIIDDAVVNFSVVLPAESRPSSSVPPTELSSADVKLPPFRSVIAWESVQRPCVEYTIDERARTSVLWVYHEDLAVASRRPELLAGTSVKTKLQRKTAEATIQEEYAATKTMLIYLYMWINHARSFYVLCPFVSKAHELHKLQNVRPLHPKDGLVKLLTENDTLVIFDTLFANNAELELTKSRCKLIFATFCGTAEEMALAEFMCADKNLPPPTLPIPFRISNSPMHIITVDPRRILLHLELTAIIFYDRKGTAHSTLYDCMRFTYDQIIKYANRIFLPRDDRYSAIIASLRRYHDLMHAAEAAEVPVITDKIMRKASNINDLIERKLFFERLFSKNDRREATKEMWIAAHNFFRQLHMERPSYEIINHVTQEMDKACQYLIEEEVRRMTLLDKFLKQRTDKVSIKVTFNGNATLLRRQIDSRTRPPLPVIDGEPSAHHCRHCGQIFDSRHYLRQHDATFHAEDESIMAIKRCKVCRVTVSGDYAYLCHLRSEEHRQRVDSTPERFQCQVCGVYFSTNRALDRHMEVQHNPNAQVFCHACCVFVADAQLLEHRLTPEHQRLVSGEDQIYCEYCKFKCRAGEEMQDHLTSLTHLRHVQAVGGLVPITLKFNRWYLLLAATEKLIDSNGYYMNAQEREAIVHLMDAKRIIDDEADFCSYATLLCISLVMKPTQRKLFISPDQRSGMLVATMNGRTGIVGHFGKGDKRLMVAEMFENMNARRLGYASIAYAPSGLHAELVAHAKSLGMKVKRTPVVTPFLGRLGVYNMYCAYNEALVGTTQEKSAELLHEEECRALDEIVRQHRAYDDEDPVIL